MKRAHIELLLIPILSFCFVFSVAGFCPGGSGNEASLNYPLQSSQHLVDTYVYHEVWLNNVADYAGVQTSNPYGDEFNHYTHSAGSIWGDAYNFYAGVTGTWDSAGWGLWGERGASGADSSGEGVSWECVEYLSKPVLGQTSRQAKKLFTSPNPVRSDIEELLENMDPNHVRWILENEKKQRGRNGDAVVDLAIRKYSSHLSDQDIKELKIMAEQKAYGTSSGLVSLGDNFPEPFNPSTEIPYSIIGNRAQPVSIKIFSSTGQFVRALVNDVKGPGSYTISWDGKDEIGKGVASGIYLYALQTDGQIRSKKMLLLK